MSVLLPFQLGDEVDDEQRTRRWLIAILCIGVAARVLRYVLRFPLWEDECFLSYNLIGRDYAQLTGPLTFQQVAPPAFLWIQKALTQLLGFSELSLRLFAFVSSLISLALFARLARLLLRSSAMLIAVAIFAVAYPAIRYSAEAKPYGIDLAVSLIIITLTVQWLHDNRPRRLWLLASFLPLAITVSFPSIFIAGAASLVILAVLMRGKNVQAWAAWAVMNALLIAAFASMIVLASNTAEQAAIMTRDWDAQFMPVSQPLELPLWFLKTFTGDAMSFPVGSQNGGSTFTFILFLCGLIALWRANRRAWIIALLLPFALHLAAAALHRYPIGGHVRLSMHLMPVICLLAGIGAAALLRLCWAGSTRRWTATCTALVALLVIGAASMTRDVLHPYKTRSDQRARGLAQWLWFDLPHEGEVACLKTDLNIDFSPTTFDRLSFSAIYLVNQHIYSPRLREGRAIDLDKVSRNWPLYIVEYRDGGKPYDHAAQRRWLAGMEERYKLESSQSLPVTRYDKRERERRTTDHLVLYRFVPR